MPLLLTSMDRGTIELAPIIDPLIANLVMNTADKSALAALKLAETFCLIFSCLNNNLDDANFGLSHGLNTNVGLLTVKPFSEGSASPPILADCFAIAFIVLSKCSVHVLLMI